VVSGATGDGEVAFGKLDAESIKTTSRDIVLRNEGGSVAQVMPGPLQAFRLEMPSQGKGIALPPGEETTLVILPPLDTAGTNREKFTLADGDSRVELQLTAEVPLSAIPATPGSIAGQILIKDPAKTPVIERPVRTRSEILKSAVISSEGAFLSDGKEDKSVPVITIVEPEIQGDDSVTFSWDLPPGDGWKFRLFYTEIQRRKEGGFVKVRRPCGDEVSYSIKGRKASATVTGMQPYVWYGYSIQTISPDGRYSFPGREFRFQLSSPIPSHWQAYWEWYVSGAVFAIAIGYWLRKKWNEPISALGA